MKALKVVYFAGLAAWLALAGVLAADVLPEVVQRVAGAVGGALCILNAFVGVAAFTMKGGANV